MKKIFGILIVLLFSLNTTACIHFSAGASVSVGMGGTGITRVQLSGNSVEEVVQGVFFGGTKHLFNNMQDGSVLHVISPCERKELVLPLNGEYQIRHKCGTGDRMIVQMYAVDQKGNRLGCAVASFDVSPYHREGTATVYQVGKPGQQCAYVYEYY